MITLRGSDSKSSLNNGSGSMIPGSGFVLHTSIFKNRPNRVDTLVGQNRVSIQTDSPNVLTRTPSSMMECMRDELGSSSDFAPSESSPVHKFMTSFRNLPASRIVDVRLRDVSYHVPINMDAPSIKTVGNQSPCYAVYLFFRRLHWYFMKSRGNRREDGEWLPRKPKDIVQPFEHKAILHNINLVLKPGKTYLILGPPGCGKTSLLKAIAGLLPHHNKENGKAVRGKCHLSGRIEFNGVTVEDEPNMVLANIVSFVGQHDNHERYLTVRETFEFAFQSRTGGKHTFLDDKKICLEMDKARFTENLTIEGLDLTSCADTFIGNENLRGVSGGQRRRVTVGEMMQGQNPVACADEISTGLDAAVTHDIVKSIVDFSKTAMTTRIISLLQPGPETFSLFDEVIVLADGYVVFAGPIEEADPYFAGLGYKRPPFMDVADFLQSIPTPDGEAMFDSVENAKGKHYSSDEFAEAFKASQQYAKIVTDLESTSPYSWRLPKHNGLDVSPGNDLSSSSNHSVSHGKAKFLVPAEYKIMFQNSLWRSLVLNFKRHLTLWKRDRATIIVKVIENVAMAATTGSILAMQGKVDWTVQEAQAGGESFADKYSKLTSAVYAALFMTAFHLLLCVNSNAPDEIDGRAIHYKHHDMKFYQSLAFVVGRLLSSIPQRVIEIVAFGIPLYWIVGLNPTAASFFTYLLILVCYTTALKLFFGIITQVLPKKGHVQGVGLFVVLLMSVFGGYIVFPEAIPNYYIWIYWMNPVAWLMQCLLSNEFMSEKYANVGVPPEAFLSTYGFQTGTEWIGYPFLFMIPFALVCALVLTLVLRSVRIEPERAIIKKRNLVRSETSNEQASSSNEQETSEVPKEFNLPFTPVDLTFDKIVYEVKASTSNQTLRILNEVSGVLRAGRMCALMGSSGAGKTTLLDVIAMRKTTGTITGEIKLNGFLQERVSFLRSSGYVEQFDVQQPELSVRETVEFCARLRLDDNDPSVGGKKGKRKFVDHALEIMELTEIQKLQVGSYEEGGLSFEQRKRLAIACELVASPSVLFLDEPTSGLESRGAMVVMKAIKRIVDTGRTVCATIHQPSAAVFELFDDLLLLMTGGNTVYFGELGRESINLINYFESLGSRKIENGENPAAWMLSVSTGADARQFFDYSAAFKQSDQYKTMCSIIDGVCESPEDSRKIKFDKTFATDFRERLRLMLKRVFIVYLRSPAYNLTRIVIAFFYSFIIASIFIRQAWKGKIYNENEASGIIGGLFFSLIITGIMSIHMAVPVMKKFRDVFYKHRASGMLEHNSISISVVFCEIPFIFLVSLLYSVVTFFTMGLWNSGGSFFLFWVFFTLNTAVYSYFGQTFMCLIRDVGGATGLVGALIGYNFFFSGFLVKPQNIGNIFLMGLWTAPGRFALEGLVMSQTEGQQTVVVANEESPFFYFLGCAPNQENPCQGTMSQYAQYYFGGVFKASNFYIDLWALIGFVLLAWGLTWFSLRKFNYTNT